MAKVLPSLFTFQSTREGWEVRGEASADPLVLGAPQTQYPSWRATLSAMPHAGSSEKHLWHQYNSSWSWRSSSHSSHPLHPWLSSFSFTLLFIPGPPPAPTSPTFSLSSSLRHILGWLLSLSALPANCALLSFWPHLVHVGPPYPRHQLPASLVKLRHSEVGLDSSQVYPTLSSSKGSPLLGSNP